ncbi:hypothetical protein HanRHA438_Chr00c29g0854771 [Helianthus annuus]|uniref:Uncharacterized protein n=1 Tax=Helianthus annuus TaxID=4232 RepID=A0A251VHJ8_HELAN|nr:hypothetical protein HanXRQr2_Chr02g0078621 [Helianthus annuus]KAJ0605672.1 hypothetical protein HanHA300_Chr02g0065581 [Helianthus annuus]KAJ0616525.1 hypothetical protein HanIR_Chr02g0091491 [Helianthus annuus]KAJ0619687.1 hypothetical protein HanHA89_Chr02g0074021 [Helianthus annuus]KAJ0778144.1 hypothetical protein HanLR1_Chr02g0068411 [Helianthus annuus]
MTSAHGEFRLQYGCAFNMIKAWEPLLNSPKWYPVPLVNPGRSSRCSKSTLGTLEPNSSVGGSDACSYLDLNKTTDDLEFEEHQELQRPHGIDKSKTAARAEANPRLQQQRIPRVHQTSPN